MCKLGISSLTNLDSSVQKMLHKMNRFSISALMINLQNLTQSNNKPGENDWSEYIHSKHVESFCQVKE